MLKNFQKSFNSVRCVQKEAMPFQIPAPINRSPTDLLEALAETVGTDSTASHYSFIDDPVTIPTNQFSMNSYYISKEMGRRAARRLVEEWPTLFQFDRDIPHLSAFRPQKPLDPEIVDPSEENLKTMVYSRHVKNALKLYSKMKENAKEISSDTLTDLFRLTSYYNGKDVPMNENDEWHGARNFFNPRNKEVNTRIFWNDDNMAEILFDETTSKTEETYSIFICGLLKFSTSDSKNRALKLLNEMINKKLVPHEEVFNLLIAKEIPFYSNLSDASKGAVIYQNNQLETKINEGKNNDQTQKMSKNWIEYMLSLGIRPSVQTFNAALSAVDMSMTKNERLKLIQSIFSEMMSYGVRPNLTTYALSLECLLTAVSRGLSKTFLQKPVNALNEALNQLESSSVDTVRLYSTDQLCHMFFVNAMYVAIQADNLSLAERVKSFYESKKNNVRMPFTLQIRFYRDYLLMRLRNSSSPYEALLVYQSLIPSVIGLDASLLIILFSSENEKNLSNWDFTNRIIQDALSARLICDNRIGMFVRNRLQLFEPTKLSEMGRKDHKELTIKIIDLWSETARVDFKNINRQWKWKPAILMQCIEMLLKLGESNRARQLFDVLLDEESYSGVDHVKIVEPEGYILAARIASFEKILSDKWKNEFKEKFKAIEEKFNIKTVVSTNREGVRRRYKKSQF